MSFWMIAGIVVAALLLTVVIALGVYFRRELQGIQSALRSIWFAFWQLWCWIYCIRWRVRHGMQNVLGQTASGVLLTGSFYVFLELAVAVFRSINGVPSHPSATDNGRFRRMLALFPTLPAPPLAVEIVLVVLAALVLVHHFHEWTLRRRESVVPAMLTELITACRPYIIKGDALNGPEKITFFKCAMTGVLTILQNGRKKHLLSAALTTQDKHDKTKIIVAHGYPDNAPAIDKSVVLKREQSAAGKVYETKEAIYVPSTKHLAGIDMKTYQTAGLVFEAPEQENEDRDEKLASLICVPILKNAAVSAVINVSSDKRNAFGPLDVAIVRLAAVLLEDADW